MTGGGGGGGGAIDVGAGKPSLAEFELPLLNASANIFPMFLL